MVRRFAWRFGLSLWLGLCALVAAHAEETQIIRDIAYADGASSAHKLDLYPARSAADLTPLIVYIHGGGWRSGDKAKVPSYILDLTQAGIAVAAVNYRLSQEAKYPAQLFDVKAAVRFLRAHAGEYHIDADKIAVWGLSAGGQLAALLGTTADEPALEGDVGHNKGVSSRVAAVVNYFGPTSLPDKPVECAKIGCLFPQTGMDATVSQLLGCDIAKCADKGWAASPISHISQGDAPFLHVHGDRDNIVPLKQSIDFDAALGKAGVASRLIIVPGARHGWNGDTPFDVEARAFLEQALDVTQPAVASTTPMGEGAL